MPAKKNDKDYKFTVSNGRATLSMDVKGSDGRYHSASCEYPLRGADGRKLSRKQVIEFLYALANKAVE